MCRQLSLERVLKTLVGLGLTHNEAEVYVHLAREGPQKAKTTAKLLRLKERSVSKILENLLKKEIINKVPEKKAIFSAIPFDKAIELLVKSHLEETKELEQNRGTILSLWKSLINKDFAG